MGPCYSLDEVKAAASEDRVELGGKNFNDRLLPWLRTPLVARSFAREVLLELSPGDFFKSIAYGDVVCDEYGIAISKSLQRSFGIQGLVTWYVKLRLEQRRGGKTVLLASLHGKVKHGEEKPSALLAALLALLARNPERRLDEVRSFWSTRTLGLPKEPRRSSPPSSALDRIDSLPVGAE